MAHAEELVYQRLNYFTIFGQKLHDLLHYGYMKQRQLIEFEMGEVFFCLWIKIK